MQRNYQYLSISLITSAFLIVFILVNFTPPTTLARTTNSPNLANATSQPDIYFVHTATSANTSGAVTYLDHPLLNNNPNAIIIVTPNWNPSLVTGVDYEKAFGVTYSATNKRWGVFSQDLSSINGQKFNIFIPGTETTAFVHTANVGNVVGNYTLLDHPELNNNPDAMILVTPNFNPGGGAVGAYHDHHIGVWYEGVSQKWGIFNQDLADMPTNGPANPSFNVVVISKKATAFVHQAEAGNISSNVTYMDHPLFENNPDALVFITANWNPNGGIEGKYNNYATGVYYSIGEANETWAIFNQAPGKNNALMEEGAAFNVLIAPQKTAVFTHRSDPSNMLTPFRTHIDSPLLNNNPNAIAFATANWNPGGINGTYNNYPIGLEYDQSYNQWTIRNLDTLVSDAPTGTFNIYVPPPSLRTFVHTATASTLASNWTILDHPMLNNNPNAIFIVTPNGNPGGQQSTFNVHPIGVWYNDFIGVNKWTIFNQDGSTPIPENAAFNVYVTTGLSNSFIYTSTAANIAGNSMTIDHPLLNGNPTAVVLVTPNWNGKTYNDHPVGVWYNPVTEKWAVFNEDLASMPENVGFNILVVDNKAYLPQILAP